MKEERNEGKRKEGNRQEQERKKEENGMKGERNEERKK